ncbi:hypothetical protein JXC34_03530 [Candidatus Woesearchaeota archaeon]|nr:hypothetical protein [Candidatus Woesearchaeota archaeon]
MKKNMNTTQTYYLIEKWTDSVRYQCPVTEYSVSSYGSLDDLMDSFNRGPEHKGKLTIAQGLDLAADGSVDNLLADYDGFYLIEKFRNDAQRYTAETRYRVKRFKSPGSFEKAILKGNPFGGELIPAVKLKNPVKKSR